MKKSLIVVLVLVLIIILVVGIKGNSNDKERIKVGIIAPLTGTAAVYGEEGKNAVVLAFEEINKKGGINGKQVDVVIEDGKCDAKAALDAWNKLVNVDKVVAVFGGHCSTETLTLAPLTKEAQVPLLAVFTTAPVIPNEGEWVFRHISTNDFYGGTLAQIAYDKGYRKIALLTEQKDFPVTYSDAFVKAFKAKGGEIVLDERFSPQTKDYRTSVLKLNGKTPDAIFISSQGPDVMGIIASQIKEAGFEKPMIFNHAFSAAKFLESSKGYMPEEYLVLTSYTDPNVPQTKKFVDAYQDRYGKPFSFTVFFVAADYDFAYRFKDAASECDVITGACVAEEIKKQHSFSGAAGDIVIDENYRVKTPLATYTIVDGKPVFQVVNQ